MNEQAFKVSEKRRQFELKMGEEQFRVAQLIKKIDSGQLTDMMPKDILTFSKKKAYNKRPLYPVIERGIDATREKAVAGTRKMRNELRESINAHHEEMRRIRD